jgi:hypothetical protein
MAAATRSALAEHAQVGEVVGAALRTRDDVVAFQPGMPVPALLAVTPSAAAGFLPVPQVDRITVSLAAAAAVFR